jgi:hypothetical protein
VIKEINQGQDIVDLVYLPKNLYFVRLGMANNALKLCTSATGALHFLSIDF